MYRHVREYWTQIVPVYGDRPLPEVCRGEWESEADANEQAMATRNATGRYTLVGRIAKMRATIEEL
jgi:hypothetical protein